jgi:hypothetical protein
MKFCRTQNPGRDVIDGKPFVRVVEHKSPVVIARFLRLSNHTLNEVRIQNACCLLISRLKETIQKPLFEKIKTLSLANQQLLPILPKIKKIKPTLKRYPYLSFVELF